MTNGPANRGEAVWVWVTRICAVVGFGWLLVTRGFEAPWGAYILLIGLFFGPDVMLRAAQITEVIRALGQIKKEGGNKRDE